MRKTLAAVLLTTLAAMTATAQNSKAPSLMLSRGGDASFHGNPSWGTLPVGSANLIFYGGDINSGDPNVEAFANGNTLDIPNTTTYGAAIPPATSHVVVTGILFNQLATQSGDIFDPATATYDVRTDIASGNGGTSVASGSGKQYASPTGRSAFNYTEYATSVALTTPFVPIPGTTYWVNESPQCTDSGNSICSALQYYASNTTQQSNSINGFAQPKGQMYFNSAVFGFSWINWCDPSLANLNSQQCAYLSFGLYGH